MEMELDTKPDAKKGKRVKKPIAFARLILVLVVLGLFGYFLWRGGILALLAWFATVIVLIDTSVNVLFGMYSESGSRRLGFMYWVASIFLGAQGTQVVTRDGNIIAFRPAGPLASIFARLGGPGMLIVENGAAIVLERSGKFTRVHGPGIVWTQRFERVAKVIDLRRQVRFKKVDKIMTHDGLSFDLDRLDVQFELTAEFAPKQGEHAFFEESLQDLVFRGGLIYLEKGEEVEWGTRVLAAVEYHLRNTAAGWSLLDIVRRGQDDSDNPREQFMQEVEDRARPALRQIGVHLVGIDIGHITGPQELRSMLVLPYREQAMVGISQGLSKAIDEVNRAMQRDTSETRPHLLVNLADTLGHLLEETLRLTGPQEQPSERPLLGSGEHAGAEKERT